MDNNLTIVVDSFDGYSDIWSTFFEVFKKNWFDCPYPLKLVSNKKSFYGIETINTGEETCWTDRTLAAIKQVDSKYVLLLLEDYLICNKVNNEKIREAVNFLEEREGKYLRLINIPKSRNNYGNDDFFKLYADEEYAVNLQAAIWDKDFLESSLKLYRGDAWSFEIGFLLCASAADHIVLNDCYGMLNDPLHIRNGVLKGKWFPSTIRFFEKNDIHISWKERGKLTIIQVIKYNLSVWLKDRMSYNMRKKIKKFLTLIGIKFVSDI